MNEERNKFTEVEMLLGGLFTLSVDGICILIDLTGVGLAIAPIVQGFTTFAMWLWFKSKNDPGVTKLGRQVAKYAANSLPIFPTTFAAFVIEVYLHNHPEKLVVVQKVATAAIGSAVTVATGGAGGGAAAVALKAAGGTKATAAVKALGGTKVGGALGKVAEGTGGKMVRGAAAAREMFSSEPAPAEETAPEESEEEPTLT